MVESPLVKPSPSSQIVAAFFNEKSWIYLSRPEQSSPNNGRNVPIISQQIGMIEGEVVDGDCGQRHEQGRREGEHVATDDSTCVYQGLKID